MAVELHDDLGQLLTAVKIKLDSAARAPSATAARELAEASDGVDQVMQRVRDLAVDLRPAVLDDLGLPAALRWFADRFARLAGLTTNLSIDDVAPLDPTIQTVFFRIAQETVTNVARHAQASQVWLDLHLFGSTLDMRIRDDGIGFDPHAARARALAGTSIGILGMEERASLAGAELELLSSPGHGTEVHVRFELAATEMAT